jgi:hypothetical protein
VTVFSILTLGALSLAPALMSDVLVGLGNCFGVEDRNAWPPGTRVIVLGRERAPASVSIERLGNPEGNCSSHWLTDLPGTIARVPLAPSPSEDEVRFAVRETADLRVVGGEFIQLSAPQAGRFVRAAGAALSGVWRAKSVLVHAYRYEGAGGRVATELYVGRPVLNPLGSATPIRDISIRRLFFIDGKLLATEDYHRTSGEEERVDTEPPQLTFSNWSRSDTEQTVAYIITNAGTSWRRLSVDIGFEGINWVVQSLSNGLPVERIYAYTPH